LANLLFFPWDVALPLYISFAFLVVGCIIVMSGLKWHQGTRVHWFRILAGIAVLFIGLTLLFAAYWYIIIFWLIVVAVFFLLDSRIAKVTK
jgi:hypothetical protein